MAAHTPISASFLPVFRGIAPRYSSSSTILSSVPNLDCSSFSAFQTCSSNGAYRSCLASTSAGLCNCNDGVQYLGCVSAAIATSSCSSVAGANDWDAYERSWF
ncbi:hypothetical protein B0T26DRAFT_751529 [Lasiosphaeria miniovina]|uniref:Uncharacterized protein n=1 Tax=Lasiosphaeria miniovina TaxID=1954250 RepID=A0AA40AKF6_9PEZI|nr:uncharacterized protein B0T26DRAFT_751529 [Lasiosphaeria miniovina]KAK0717478.1 hypothetical protein B0T26DRAFT_751529 [Lasiosphaeria miniovina]